MDTEHSGNDSPQAGTFQASTPAESAERHARHHRQTGAVINRLSRTEGHFRAIKRMPEEGRPCPDALLQLAAVRSAIDRASSIVLQDHLEFCLRQAAEDGTAERELKELRRALDRFIK